MRAHQALDNSEGEAAGTCDGAQTGGRQECREHHGASNAVRQTQRQATDRLIGVVAGSANGPGPDHGNTVRAAVALIGWRCGVIHDGYCRRSRVVLPEQRILACVLVVRVGVAECAGIPWGRGPMHLPVVILFPSVVRRLHRGPLLIGKCGPRNRLPVVRHVAPAALCCCHGEIHCHGSCRGHVPAAGAVPQLAGAAESRLQFALPLA